MAAGLKYKMKNKWGRSSVGRAPALQAGGQEFESLRLHCGFICPLKIKEESNEVRFFETGECKRIRLVFLENRIQRSNNLKYSN